MSNIVALCGSPQPNSRTGALLAHVVLLLRSDGSHVTTMSVVDVPPEVLIEGRTSHPAAARLLSAVSCARGVVIGTPVHNAAYSGALKALLDLLPQGGLTGKTVLPLATGGSAGHMLAIDYALRPVLVALDARQVVRGYFAHEDQFTDRGAGPVLTEAAKNSLRAAVAAFTHAVGAPDRIGASVFTP